MTVFRMVLIVSILTTPGTTVWTMGAKLPRGRPSRGTAVSSNGTLMRGVSDLALDPWLTASAEPAATTAPAIAKADSRLRSVLDVVFIIMIVLFIVSVEFDTWRNDWKLSGTLQNCKNETLEQGAPSATWPFPSPRHQLCLNCESPLAWIRA